MKLAEAADVYERVKPQLEAMAQDLKDYERAERTLKEHFRSTGKRRYRNIGCSFGARRFLSQPAVRELLGSKVEECMREGTTVSLLLLTPATPADEE